MNIAQRRIGARHDRVKTMYSYSKNSTRSAALAAASSYAQARSAFAAVAAWIAQSWVGRVAASLLREREERLAIDELRSWDDHMLRDIGLERMHIEPAVRGIYRPLPQDADVPRPPPHPYF
jgi:uncharacterized protein YjiS (DUF1127 family)